MDIYKINSIEELIKGNPYVGRGIVIGMTPDGKNAVTAYFIMGRSENSRNRIFAEDGDCLYTRPYDESKVKDPSLIIYAAIRKIGDRLIVTNGDQTDTIYESLENGKCMNHGLKKRTFEPDGPNWTPRISGVLDFSAGGFSYEMSILKSIDAEGSDCARYLFSYPGKAGLGHFLHTYVTDGEPIPTFQGEPERMAMNDDIEAFTKALWEDLDEANKISLYVRYTDLETGECTNRLINRNQ